MTAISNAPSDASATAATTELWRAECRRCGQRTDHHDRESAHLAVIEHIAATGHTGETRVSGHFEVWRSEVDGRLSVRAHQMTITIGVAADGTFAAEGTLAAAG